MYLWCLSLIGLPVVKCLGSRGTPPASYLWRVLLGDLTWRLAKCDTSTCRGDDGVFEVGRRFGTRVGQRKGLIGKADKVDVTMWMVIDGQPARDITWCVDVDAG
jgi:hypothetical protein